MSLRAGLVITGTEVLAGRVQDRNGPWLADRLTELGVELAHVIITGDRPDDMTAALKFLRGEGVELIVTSGGLGPTADDLTAAVVADFAERPLVLDEALERRISAILARFARRWRLDTDALQIANRKQAMVPTGAVALDPVGTAPGLVVPAGGQVVVVLPGPPRELQDSWRQAVATEPFKRATESATAYDQSTLRLFGVPESEIAQTLREAEHGGGLDGLEVTTCLRRGELEVVIRSEPHTAAAAEGLIESIAAAHGDGLFSVDGGTIDDRLAELLEGRRLAVAESCTGGMLAARITDRPGASAYFAGGVVAYSNEAKTELLGVAPGLIEQYGAVSEQVAEALADGAAARFDADVAIGVTGVAGPGGGTADRPVGRVCLSVRIAEDGVERRVVRELDIPGTRFEIRDRSVTVALHLARRLLQGREAPV